MYSIPKVIFPKNKDLEIDKRIRDFHRCSICGNPIDILGEYCSECFEKYCEEITGKSYEDYINERTTSWRYERDN